MNPTQWMGVTSFLLAAISHMHVGILRQRAGQAGQQWWFAISTLYSAVCIELMTNRRYAAIATVREIVVSDGHYGERQPVQTAGLIMVVYAVAWLMLRANAASRRDAALKWSLIASLWTMFLFLAEVISLHQVDAVMYQQVGPTLLIGWLWVGTAFVATATTWRAVVDPRNRPSF